MTVAKSKNAALAIDNTDWQVQSDLDTIVRAEEIKSDPKRYAKVQKLAKSKIESMEETFGEDSEADDKGKAKGKT
jgi:uncharacterized membrane-anchored protein YjiN (DUF445 family)